MTRILFGAAAGAALMLAGCATIPPGPLGSELYGQTVRVEPADGAQAFTMRFAPDGTVRGTVGAQTIDGRWWVQDRQICFDWPNLPRECWPYAEPLRRGQTVTTTSTRGNTARVTLL